MLAIAAARLGFAPVLGLDHERESVEAARENAAANGVEIEVRRFDLRARGAAAGSSGARRAADRSVVVANLLRPLLLELARTMPCAPAQLLAGGLLEEEVDEVAGAFAERLGLRVRERRAERRMGGRLAGRALTEPCQGSADQARVGYLGGRAHDRAIDQVDRRAQAVLAAWSSASAALSAAPIVSSASPTVPGSGSRQAAIAMSSIARAWSTAPVNSAGPTRLA